MDEPARIVVQLAHVLSGVLWIGGGYYTMLVQLPAVESLPLPARGPALAAIGPRQVRYILRVAELTLATGVLQILVGGRGGELQTPFGTRWSTAIVIGIVAALVGYGLLRGALKPAITKLLAAAPAAMKGDETAAAQVPKLRNRIRTVGRLQMALGALILAAMITARFS